MAEDKQNMLLAKGIISGGVVTAGMAYSLYSSNESARSALQSLESQGWITQASAPGKFYVLKESEEVREMVETLKENERKRKEIEDKLSSA